MDYLAPFLYKGNQYALIAFQGVLYGHGEPIGRLDKVAPIRHGDNNDFKAWNGALQGKDKSGLFKRE